MPKPSTVIGWKLLAADREKLLRRFPPSYEKVVADHVTLTRTTPDTPLPKPPMSPTIIGHADDGRGVECLVVALDGSPDRPDGSFYHITWSLGSGRAARESNDVLRSEGWNDIETPIPIQLTPARF